MLIIWNSARTKSIDVPYYSRCVYQPHHLAEVSFLISLRSFGVGLGLSISYLLLRPEMHPIQYLPPMLKKSKKNKNSNSHLSLTSLVIFLQSSSLAIDVSTTHNRLDSINISLLFSLVAVSAIYGIQKTREDAIPVKSQNQNSLLKER